MTDKQSPKYNIHENIAKNLIFIDGITRSGKGMLSGIVPSLENVEKFCVFNLLEQVLPALAYGSIDTTFAKALLRSQLNELAYTTMLSRDVNFRYSDETGVFNFKDPSLYFKRLAREDGDDVVKELRGSKVFFPFKTHDVLINYEALKKLEMDFYILEIFRHPVDVVHSWWKRGWGVRFGNDPRAFSLSIEYKGEKLPWYAASFADEWIKLNPMERCVRTVVDLADRSIKEYGKIKDASRVHILTFEKFVEDPKAELKRICKFLGTKTTEYTDYALARARCPRELKKEERSKKMKDIESNAGKKYIGLLEEKTALYEKNEGNYIRK